MKPQGRPEHRLRIEIFDGWVSTNFNRLMRRLFSCSSTLNFLQSLAIHFDGLRRFLPGIKIYVFVHYFYLFFLTNSKNPHYLRFYATKNINLNLSNGIWIHICGKYPNIRLPTYLSFDSCRTNFDFVFY